MADAGLFIGSTAIRGCQTSPDRAGDESPSLPLLLQEFFQGQRLFEARPNGTGPRGGQAKASCRDEVCGPGIAAPRPPSFGHGSFILKFFDPRPLSVPLRSENRMRLLKYVRSNYLR